MLVRAAHQDNNKSVNLGNLVGTSTLQAVNKTQHVGEVSACWHCVPDCPLETEPDQRRWVNRKSPETRLKGIIQVPEENTSTVHTHQFCYNSVEPGDAAYGAPDQECR